MSPSTSITRRQLLDGMAAGAAGLAISASAASYSRILGANDRVNFAIIGLNGRAYAHLAAMKANAASAQVTHVCDVESTILARFADAAEASLGYRPATAGDFRRVLSLPDVDAVTIATPEHWHTPMAIMAMAAGKHVYVEKPISHNPAEGVMLLAAHSHYGKVAQMGSQQRSSPHTIEIVGRIHSGLIGRAYAARAWYVNTRKSIGHGRPAPVPATLDWELWQGPAPREGYRDNVQPYNWHWFRNWGTGETLNNGTHEVDVCRWALDVGYPNLVTAQGGRYQFHDDWQFYDTLETSFAYDDKLISWDGRSCNGMKVYGRDRGSVIFGTTGSVIVDRDGWELYDLGGKMTDEFRVGTQTSSADKIGADSMTNLHFANFIAAIRTGEKLHAPVEIGNVAVTMLQLSNIAWITGSALHLDPHNGAIHDNYEAQKLWGRSYQPGWEPKTWGAVNA